MSKTKKLFVIILSSVVFLFIILLIVFINTKMLNSDQTNPTSLATIELKVPEVSGLQGGYLPKNEIVIGDYKFACMIINTDSDDKIEEILLEIKDKEEKSLITFSPCLDFSVNSNKLILKPTTTKIGDISFEGIFLPVKNGDYMNIPWNVSVLKGKLIIISGGESIYSKDDQEFTFMYGD